MIDYKDIDAGLKYYDIDLMYKDRCYECVKNINSNSKYLNAFNKVLSILNSQEFINIKSLWKYKSVDELFYQGIDSFVTNIMIILNYKEHDKNIKEKNLDSNQIIIHKNRVKECFLKDLEERHYNSVRISQMLWAFYFIRLRIIEIGRLQYEYLETIDNISTIKIHIPGGKKLIYDDVIESIDNSYKKIKKIFKINNLCYKCYSWLLSNKLNEIIDKNSNIHKFYSLFNVEDGDDCKTDLLNFIFHEKDTCNLDDLSENTSLQKIIKKELIKGTQFKIGIGTLKKNISE